MNTEKGMPGSEFDPVRMTPTFLPRNVRREVVQLIQTECLNAGGGGGVP